jgi:hypothetical protein
MGITAEQIAAQNQAALDEQALFESILGGVETQREQRQGQQKRRRNKRDYGRHGARQYGYNTYSYTTGTATTDTTYTNFINQFAGRELTAADAAALAGSGYSLNQLATSFGVMQRTTKFVNFHTRHYSTTDSNRLTDIDRHNRHTTNRYRRR